MKKFKVFAERTEILYVIIEADSAEEAEELADKDYYDYDWSEINGSQYSEILFGEAEETDE